MPAHRKRTGALATISVSRKTCLADWRKWTKSQKLPSSLYTMASEEEAAQLEAMVGKVKKGLFRSRATSLAVSTALPPPTAKIMSAL